MPLNIQIICICSKNAVRKNIDFLKNTAECGIDVLKKDITFIKIYNIVKDCEGKYRIFRRKIHGDLERR
jgi:hypothetical protein